MSSYRDRVVDALAAAITDLGPVPRLLDFGAGDGGVLRAVLDRCPDIGEWAAVDVQPRATTHLDVALYDGERLPFADAAFHTVMAVDVVHHCPDPTAALADLARTASCYVVLKDHTYRSRVGYAALAVLDEIGNRRFGVPSRYNYQRGWSWDDVLATAGFRLRHRTSPLVCHGDVRALTNRLQYLAVYERVGAPVREGTDLP